MVYQYLFKGGLSKITSVFLLVNLGACQSTSSVLEQPVLLNNEVKSVSLIGQSPAQIRSLLGQANLERRDLPAELWQFQGTDCVMDVFFYSNPGQTARVTHIMSRLRTGPAVDNDRCLAKLVRKTG